RESVAKLADADTADTNSADLALGAQGSHLRQLTVEVDTRSSITREPQVDDIDPLHLEASQVRLDPGSQLVGALRGDPAALPVTRSADLGDQHQVLWVWMERSVDQLVGDVGTVILGGVDVVDAELDCPAQQREGRGPIARRSQHTWTGQLHGAEADPGHRTTGQHRAAAWLLLRAQELAGWNRSPGRKSKAAMTAPPAAI